MPTHGRETQARHEFLINGRYGAVHALAMSQQTTISTHQLLGLGVSHQLAHEWIHGGRLQRVFRGVYSIVPVSLLSRHGWWMAAVLACGEGARLSHLACAHLLNIRPSSGRRIDLTIPRRSALRVPRLRVHRAELPPSHVTDLAGIPCTTLARTLLDIAGDLSLEGLRRVFAKAEDERLDFSGLPELIAESAGRPGIGNLRRVAAEKGIGVDVTRNGLEEAFLAICRRRRLPRPRVNFWLDLNDGLPMVELDFYWPELRASVETDGAGGHGTIRGVERDYAKERRVARAGIQTTRFSEPEVFADPRRIGEELTEYLARTGLLATPALRP